MAISYACHTVGRVVELPEYLNQRVRVFGKVKINNELGEDADPYNIYLTIGSGAIPVYVPKGVAVPISKRMEVWGTVKADPMPFSRDETLLCIIADEITMGKA